MINLHANSKSCDCGKTKGRYLDSLNAIYTGRYAVPVGIDNYSFFSRLEPKDHTLHNLVYDRWHGKDRIQCWLIEKKCTTIKKLSLKDYNQYGKNIQRQTKKRPNNLGESESLKEIETTSKKQKRNSKR
jgi:hypothetical protein